MFFFSLHSTKKKVPFFNSEIIIIIFPILPFQRSFSPPLSVKTLPPTLPEVAVRPAAVAPWVSWPKPRGRRRRCTGPEAPRCRRRRRRRDPPRHPVHREVATGEEDTGGGAYTKKRKMWAEF